MDKRDLSTEQIDPERFVTKRLSEDGRRIVVIERWYDRQLAPPRWRSKNRHVKLTPGEVEYFWGRLGA
jgi:hypothetical protein